MRNVCAYDVDCRAHDGHDEDILFRRERSWLYMKATMYFDDWQRALHYFAGMALSTLSSAVARQDIHATSRSPSRATAIELDYQLRRR